MTFDSQEQKQLVLDIVSASQITTTIGNLQKAAADMSTLVKAIVEAEVRVDAVQK